jgi:poly-beta-1,6-N-acetyl-D-glucosamine N-deacetylase
MKFLKGLLVLAVFVLLLLGAIFWALPLKGSIPILMYHFVVPEKQVGPTSLDVSTTLFEQQMWFLKTFGFKPISLYELHAIKTDRQEATGREVAITFDDGNASYATYALPILEKFGFPSANFLVEESVLQELHGSMDLKTVKQIAANPIVTLGSHTRTHEVLTQMRLEKVVDEVMGSKLQLEKAIGREIHFFTYPTGQHDEEIVRLVEDAGYLLGFTSSRKYLHEKETLFSLTRYKINPNDNLASFWLKLAGITDLVQRLKYSFRY